MVGKLNPIVARALEGVLESDPASRSTFEQFTDLRANPQINTAWQSLPNQAEFGRSGLMQQQRLLNSLDQAPSVLKEAAQSLTSGLGSAVGKAFGNILGKASSAAGGGGSKYGFMSGGAGGSASGVDIDRILATIRQLESGNNYTARNPYSTASGAYQFINSTWGGYGGYSNAAAAPKHVQDAKARQDVMRFLAANNNNIQAVPGMWYSPAVWQSGNLNRNPGGPGNPLTVQQYIDRWMKTYNSL